MPSKSKSKGKMGATKAKADLLDEVSGCPHTFERAGVEAVLDCYMGSQLSEQDVNFCVELLGDTMKMLHESTGGARGTWDAATKAEFVGRLREQKSRVFMVRSSEGAKPAEGTEDEWVLVEGNGDDALVDVNATPRKNLGFVLVQLSTDKAPPAPANTLIVFEMQLVPEMRGKGLGKHVMEVVQMIATKMGLTLVLYNLFKANARALQALQAGTDTPTAIQMAPMVKAH